LMPPVYFRASFISLLPLLDDSTLHVYFAITQNLPSRGFMLHTECRDCLRYSPAPVSLPKSAEIGTACSSCHARFSFLFSLLMREYQIRLACNLAYATPSWLPAPHAYTSAPRRHHLLCRVDLFVITPLSFALHEPANLLPSRGCTGIASVFIAPGRYHSLTRSITDFAAFASITSSRHKRRQRLF